MAYPYGEPLKNIGKERWDFREFEGRDSVDLLARLIHSEAENQSLEGKQGVAHVVRNRKAKDIKEFGYDTYEGVILKEGAFDGMNLEKARTPDLESETWQEALDIARNMKNTPNPIGNCLWFNGNKTYKNRVTKKNGDEYYKFPGTSAKEVVEKVVIEDHTFFRVKGY